MTTSAFDRLHPALQYHIVNALEWANLRPTQLEAIEPILCGRDCLVLAPTAGGKTEAALFPILSRMLAEDWRGLSVLYICPIKALLNNLEERLARFASLVGRRVQVWHGDVSQSAKARALKDAPDILLTTPESLEGMLISTRVDRGAWFGVLRCVIVDELHAFAGDDRGWHLRAILGRLQDFVPDRVQRIGLSATIGNPDELLHWFSADEEGCIIGKSAAPADAEVMIDFVGSLGNAATVLSRLNRGTKRLVFCDSRSGVEELASGLRGLGARTFVSHSSLSISERKQAEQAFSQDPDCIIVATSTLELGIDVGDLDYVNQIDAPSTVSSFLQRMGRSGRRLGTKRNYLFLATNDESFLIACGLVRLWKEGYVEPVVPPPEPWHLVAQQAMAIVLQTGGVGIDACQAKVGALFPELPASGIQEVLSHMCATDILSLNDGLLGIGVRGEKLYGRQNFLDLLSSFASPLQLSVRYGATNLGYIDPIVLRASTDDLPALLLGGHSWHVTNVEWDKRIVWVEPAHTTGKARWIGSSRALGFELCQAIKRVLSDGEVPVSLSKRAVEKFSLLREAFPQMSASNSTIEHLGNGLARWWTFAGGRANWLIAYLLRQDGHGVRFDDFCLETKGEILPSRYCDRVQSVAASELGDAATASGLFDLKFGEAVPNSLLASEAAARAIDRSSAAAIVFTSVEGTQPSVSVNNGTFTREQ